MSRHRSVSKDRGGATGGGVGRLIDWALSGWAISTGARRDIRDMGGLRNSKIGVSRIGRWVYPLLLLIALWERIRSTALQFRIGVSTLALSSPRYTARGLA